MPFFLLLRHLFLRGSIDSVAEMKAQGLLASTDFHAVRAFELEEYEDEGPHFFIELSDKSVLYLNGQYLYEYEPNGVYNDAEPRFPCTQFTVRRHQSSGYIIDILCDGDVLDLEAVIDVEDTPPSKDLFKDVKLEAGSLITQRSYEQIKHGFAKPGF